MEFRWEPLTAADHRRILRDWQRGKGLLGGDPRLRPSDAVEPAWAEGQPFIRALMLDAPATQAAVRFLEQRAAAPSIELEIGPARADFILNRARHHPNTLFLGVEVLTAAVRRALARRARQELDNIWFCDDDVRFALPRLCTRRSLAAVHVLFPDPWWKRRHEHRRLMTPPFLSLLAEHMAPGGLLHVRSDVPEFMALDGMACGAVPGLPPSRHGPGLPAGALSADSSRTMVQVARIPDIRPVQPPDLTPSNLFILRSLHPVDPT